MCYDFPSFFFTIFINIHEYANEIICISDKRPMPKLLFGTMFYSLD